mgnify:CR=1 FL=1
MNKRVINFLLVAMLLPFSAWAGGLVTNTNQSASFIRKPVQDAVIDATGTYYNPAGLAFLEDGFHLSLSNQTISQTRTISNDFAILNRNKFEGSVSAPLFPTVYAVYKAGPLAVSFGVNPIGGGGSANFENGLPSFERQVAVLPSMLTDSNFPTSAYSMEAAFDGSSLNWGFQLNGSYALNEVFSVSAGARFILANNAYTGHLRNVMINPNHVFNPNGPGNMVSAVSFFENAAFRLNLLATGAGQFAVGLQPIINNDYGDVMLINGTTVGLTVEQIQQILGILTAAGLDPSGIDIQTAQAMLIGAAPIFAEGSQKMQSNIPLVTNKELDASQSGWGIAPVLGINIRFSDDLNVGIKYEHKASITMTNKTVVDDVGMYPDGVETANDMPSMLSVGVSYRPMSPLTLSAGMHYYFDKSADYGKSLPNDQIIDNNFYELAFGAEYYIGNGISLSAGFLRTQTGVNELWHSDLSHSLSTNSIGAGLKYQINNNIAVNAGFMNTMYETHTKNFTGYTETYDRVARTFAIGLDFKF